MEPLKTSLLLCLALTKGLCQDSQFQREVENVLNCIPAEQSRNGDTVLVTYKGFLADGTVFDSNEEAAEPLSFKLGTGRVIAGWEKGLVRTCPGEKVVMIIPPELGYGSKGAGGGVIPGGATLYFITTLNGVVRTTREGTAKEGGVCKDLKTVKAGDSVTMTSTVSLLSTNNNGIIVPGTRVDTSTDTVKVGAGQLVKGWEAGVLGACEGESRRLVLGPSLAWGTRGVEGRVPGNSSIVIDVSIDHVERDLVLNFLDQISSGTFKRG